MPANARPKRSNLKTDDMDRWRVELRMTLDREHRRFHKANDVDHFEELLKAKLTDKSQQQHQHSQGLSLNLTRLDDGAFSKLTNFLRTFMCQCPTIEEQNKLHKVLRDLLVELKQELYKKNQGCTDPYCLFCGTSIQQQQQQPIANDPCNLQLQQNNYTPNVAEAVSTPPPSAAPTPDEGLLNHSLQRLQSQFGISFSKQNGGGLSATSPMTANAVAALRLRQNQEAQRALDEARNATSQSNASPIGLINLNQQPNGDEDDDDERSEVASVREMVRNVDRIISNPTRGRQRGSTPMSSSDSSSDLVMDVSADASASQTTEPDTPTFKKIKKMREEQTKPRGGFRTKRGGPRRNDSQRISQPQASNSRR